MLRGIYAPTDLGSFNRDSGIPAEEKLKVIADSPVVVRPLRYNGVISRGAFRLCLPFTGTASFRYGAPNWYEALGVQTLHVGDKELYGQGIGTRLLKVALRYAADQEPGLHRLKVGAARLGVVNTVVKVVGEENVGVRKGKSCYGLGSDWPLDAVFDDFPPPPGEPYAVDAITALVDPAAISAWEMPITPDSNLTY